MKTIRLIVEENEGGQITKVEKTFSWEEFQRFSWSTMAELFYLTVIELDNELTFLERKP